MPDLYPREQLCQLLERYGSAIVADRKLCKNLLNDFVPTYRLEIHLLVVALEQGMVDQLLKPNTTTPIALQLSRLTQSLRDITGIESDLAYWAIESWALALEVITEPLSKPATLVFPDLTNTFENIPIADTKKSNTKLIFFTTGLLAFVTFSALVFKQKPVKEDIKPPISAPVQQQLEKPSSDVDSLPVPSNVDQVEDAWTQNHLGELYYYGHDVLKNYKTAVDWYRKAAEQGHAIAQCNLAYMYAQGLGIPKDYQQAVYWYQKAADQGNPEGQNSLGIMYENGDGVAKDKQQAIFLYTKAAEQGHYGAQQKLGQLVR